MTLFNYSDRPLARMHTDWQAIRNNETAERLRREVLEGFSAVGKDDKLLRAIRVLIENAREEAVSIATAPPTPNARETDHAAGGAYWMELLDQRIRDAWDEAHKKPI